jgi:hypothetical protein
MLCRAGVPSVEVDTRVHVRSGRLTLRAVDSGVRVCIQRDDCSMQRLVARHGAAATVLRLECPIHLPIQAVGFGGARGDLTTRALELSRPNTREEGRHPPQRFPKPCAKVRILPGARESRWSEDDEGRAARSAHQVAHQENATTSGAAQLDRRRQDDLETRGVDNPTLGAAWVRCGPEVSLPESRSMMVAPALPRRDDDSRRWRPRTLSCSAASGGYVRA